MKNLTVSSVTWEIPSKRFSSPWIREERSRKESMTPQKDSSVKMMWSTKKKPKDTLSTWSAEKYPRTLFLTLKKKFKMEFSSWSQTLSWESSPNGWNNSRSTSKTQTKRSRITTTRIKIITETFFTFPPSWKMEFIRRSLSPRENSSKKSTKFVRNASKWNTSSQMNNTPLMSLKFTLARNKSASECTPLTSKESSLPTSVQNSIN